MLADYDVRRTCRTCLRKANDLIPLDRASYIEKIDSESEESISNETHGDLLMECANVEVRIGGIAFDANHSRKCLFAGQYQRWIAFECLRRMRFGTNSCFFV